MSPRTRLVMLSVAIVAATVLALTWSRPERYANFPPTLDGPWVAFGDSLTAGVGAEPGQDYPSRLGHLLNVVILNLGRSGDTTDTGLARLEEVISLKPSVVLLCLGGNDALNGTSRSQTFSNIGTMLDRLLGSGAFVVLIGVRSASLRDRNEEPFARLAAEKKVFHIPDILQGIAFKPVYMSDAVHPNEEGYRRIAERLAKELRPFRARLVRAKPGGA